VQLAGQPGGGGPVVDADGRVQLVEERAADRLQALEDADFFFVDEMLEIRAC
jgi:hypothetical protein